MGVFLVKMKNAFVPVKRVYSVITRDVEAVTASTAYASILWFKY